MARRKMSAWSSTTWAGVAAERQLNVAGGCRALDQVQFDLRLNPKWINEWVMASAEMAQRLATRMRKIEDLLSELNLDVMDLRFEEMGEVENRDLNAIRRAAVGAMKLLREATDPATRVAAWARSGKQDLLAKRSRESGANVKRAIKNLSLDPRNLDVVNVLARRIVELGLPVEKAGLAYYTISRGIEPPCSDEQAFARLKDKCKKALQRPKVHALKRGTSG